MAWDCRIRCRLNLFSVIILKVLLIQIFATTELQAISRFVRSADISCEDVHHCICFRPPGDDYYTIECPNKQLESYPVTLKVYPQSNIPGQGSVSVTCDSRRTDFDWRLVRGLNLGKSGQRFKITKVSIISCPIPPPADGLAMLLKHLNIPPEQITAYEFKSYKNLAEMPDYMLSPMVNLLELTLDNNKLSTFPNLTYFPKLIYLNMQYNNMTILTRENLINNKELTNFYVTNNDISHIEEGALPDSLLLLNLSQNKISTVTNKTFANLKNLKSLFMVNNLLSEMDAHALDGLTKLRTLKMDGGKFPNFPALRNSSLLENVSITYNPRLGSNCRRSNQTMEVVTTAVPTMESDDESVTTNAPENESTVISPNSTNNNATESNQSSLDFPVRNFDCVIHDLPSLKKLSLVQDDFEEVPYFENLPNISTLYLSKNNIKTVPLDAFAMVTSLQVLDLSTNKISYISALPLFNLIELNLSRNRMTSLDKSVFSALNKLKRLYISHNKISYIDPQAFASLTKLEDLDLSDNMIDFAAPPPLGKTPALDLGFKTTGQSPLRSSLYIKRINLSNNQINKIPDDFYIVMLQLQSINLSHNRLTTLRAADLTFIQSNIDVDLSSNQISFIDMEYWNIFLARNNNNNNVNNVSIRLDENPVDCNCSLLALKLFQQQYEGGINLRLNNLFCEGPTSPRNLTGLRFEEVGKEDFLCPFKVDEGCPKECQCWRRPVDFTVIVDCDGKYADMDKKLPQLSDIQVKENKTEYDFILDLSNNGITQIPDDFTREIGIRFSAINFRGNKLQSLGFLKTVALRDNNVTRFNLSDNPFPCNDCDFHTISRSQFSRIWDNDNLSCITNEASEVRVKKALDFNYEDTCTNSSMVNILVPILCGIILIFLILGIVYIRYGWAIRAYLYSKGYGRFLCDNDFEDNDEKMYDAFVSYSHRDETWVLEELVNRLEEQEGFKLCLHFRDWIPGDWIPDQIVRSVDQSRRTVVILSKHFVESVWSRLEFKAALASQGMSERSNRLILVLMGEELTEKDIQDDDLRMYMKTNTYIKWNDPWFWHKLKYALPHMKSDGQNIKKMVQRDRAIKLDKMRSKMENDVQIMA